MLFVAFLVFSAVGTVMHFLYAPLGRPKALAFLLPVSESVWEHYKLAFWPLCGAVAWVGDKWGAEGEAVLLACFCCTVHAGLCMFGLFYTYVCGLGTGKNILWVDIVSYYMVMASGAHIGFRMLQSSPGRAAGILGLLWIVFMAAVFQVISFRQPDFPIFKS